MQAHCMQQFLILLVALAAAYSIMVSVCVSGRMTRQTRHVIRWPVMALGGLACWALLRTVEGDWSMSAVDVGHAVTVIAGGVILAISPRIRT